MDVEANRVQLSCFRGLTGDELHKQVQLTEKVPERRNETQYECRSLLLV